MIDCGADWLRALPTVSPTAIVLTHGHPDHAFGLASGAPCPVYASAETWSLIARYKLDDCRVVEPRLPFAIGGVRFEAFPVQHSLRAPAVGYRVSAGHATFFYVPDLAAIPEQRAALRGIDLYVGDGATVVRSMVRVKDHSLIGHAPDFGATWLVRGGRGGPRHLHPLRQWHCKERHKTHRRESQSPRRGARRRRLPCL